MHPNLLASLLPLLAIMPPSSAAPPPAFDLAPPPTGPPPRRPLHHLPHTWLPSWDVQIEPHRPETVVVNGTIQQVSAYMERRFPGRADRWANFTASFPGQQTHMQRRNALHRREVLARRNALLRKREGYGNGGGGPRPPDFMKLSSPPLCNQPRRRCATGPIIGAVFELRQIDRDRHPRNDAGPRNCGKVSCDANAAVIWCNDSTEPKILNSFADIAFGVDVVLNACAKSGMDYFVSGEAFMFGDYAVVVGAWPCNKDFPQDIME